MNLIANVLAVLPTSAPAAGAPGAAPAPTWFSYFSNPILVLPILFLLAMQLFGGKGKRADEKSRQAQLKLLKRGDRIQTIGGVLGAVVRAEETRVEVKVDESSNVKIWFARNAISKVVEADKADAK